MLTDCTQVFQARYLNNSIQKTSTIFWPISYVIHAIYMKAHILLGRQIIATQDKTLYQEYDAPGRKYLEASGGKIVKFKSADGLTLEGMHFVGKNCDEKNRTIILCNGARVRYEHNQEDVLFDVRQWQETGSNVFLFNYRGVGNSEGVATRNGLYLDAEAATQYVNNELQVPLEHIILHGHSLGAPIGAKIAADYQGVHYCNDRSFISLSTHAKEAHGNGIVGTIIAFAIVALGWEMETLPHWGQITGRKWILQQPQDKTIRTSGFATLFNNSKTCIVNMQTDLDEKLDAHTRGLKGEREFATYQQMIESCG